MSAGAPWSVKGIDPKAREVAKDLARRSGMTLGEWLNQMIMDGDELEDAVVTPLGRRPAPPPGADRRDRYRRLDDAYGSSTRIPDQAFDDRDAYGREGEFARIAEAMERLTARIEAAESRSTLAISGVDQAVAGLLARMEAQARDQSSTSVRVEHVAEELREDHARMLDRVRQVEREAEQPRSLEAIKALETALGKIANQLYEGDARTRAAIGEIREDVTGVTRRMDRVEAAHGEAHVQTALQGAMDGVVARVAERLEQAEARTSAAVRALESSFTHLDDRLQLAEGKLGGDREGRFEKLAEDLSARVEDARNELISRFDSVTAEMGDRLGRFDQVDRAIAELSGHVQAAEQRSAQAVEKMGHEVLRIAQNLNRRMTGVEQAGAQAMQQAQGEMARMAQAVENRLRKSEEGHAQGVERLGQEIAKISERLSERIAHSERRSALAADDMGERIGRIADKLDARWDRVSAEISDRIRQSEERTARLLQEGRETVDRTLNRAPEARPEPAAEPVHEPRVVAAAAAPAPTLTMPEPEVEAVIPTRPWTEADAPTPFGAQTPFGSQSAFDAPEPVAEEPAFPPFPAASSQGFDQAEPAQGFGGRTFDDFFEAPAEPAPVAAKPEPAFDDFSGDTEFLSPDEVKPNRPPVSTKEAIQAARAAARLGIRNSAGGESASLFGGVKAGGKSRLQERVEKESKRDGAASTMKKALMASTIAALLVGASVGYMTLFREAEKNGGKSNADLLGGGDHAPLAAVAINTPPPADLAQAQKIYQEAVTLLEGDKPGGVEQLARAANLGYGPAQYELAGRYLKGEGVRKDPTEARRWTERAADGGDRRAMYNLGMYNFDGMGGPQDQGQAVKWFRKSAELGFTDAQYNLARLYELGLGVPADGAEAYKWYLVAAKAGDQESKTAAAALKPKLSPDDRSSAEKAAATFRASESDPTDAAAR
ncbi:MAG: SEL1-like repeat protein [Proteobacteria bacterium]|nr:SEL1-like repeat protein [Pseudomonadota bacterium]